MRGANCFRRGRKPRGSALFSRFEKSVQGGDQEAGSRAVGRKTVMPVKGFGGGILGLDDHGMHANLRSPGALHGIEQKRAAEPHPVKLPVDSKPPKPDSRNRRIARKAFYEFFRYIHDGNIGCRERVISCGRACHRMSGHVTGRDAPPYILANLCTEIPVKRFTAALESRAILLAKR